MEQDGRIQNEISNCQTGGPRDDKSRKRCVSPKGKKPSAACFRSGVTGVFSAE